LDREPIAQLFRFEEQTVRIIMKDDLLWWVLKDVMMILGLRNPTEAVRSLDEDEFIITELIDSLGRNQKTYIINEPGLYSLILRSRKPEAKAFKRWIVHEVLPAIRKTGTYSVQPIQPLDQVTELTDILRKYHHVLNERSKLAIKRQMQETLMTRDDQLQMILDDIKGLEHVSANEFRDFVIACDKRLSEKLPIQPEKKEKKERWYTTTEIAQATGVSARRVAMLAKQFKIRGNPIYSKVDTTGRLKLLYNRDGKRMLTWLVKPYQKSG